MSDRLSDRPSYAKLAALSTPTSAVVTFPTSNVSTGPAAPTPNESLRVEAAIDTSLYLPAKIMSMTHTQRKDMYFGYLTNLFINVPGGVPKELKIRKVSVNALCALSSVIEAAVDAGLADRSHLDQLALPPGDDEAYKLIFAWLEMVMKDGVIHPFPKETETPLHKYWNVLEIARELRITPLTNSLKYRFDYMLIYEKGEKWNIEPEDIKKAYTDLQAGHPLRQMILENVAKAMNNNGIWGRKREAIEDLTWEFAEFWEELQSKQNELMINA